MDYYSLLGVDRSAAAAEIQRVWRQLALRWHPDRAGPGATATFQKLLAAYAVLSDPMSRAAYDRRTARPLPPAPAVMLRRLCGSLTALLACGIARRGEDGVIELVLTAQEASEGGMVTISMRVAVRCPACAADGSCEQCGGSGAVEEVFSAWLAVRPGVADGTILTPSALLPDMLQPVTFRVRRRT